MNWIMFFLYVMKCVCQFFKKKVKKKRKKKKERKKDATPGCVIPLRPVHWSIYLNVRLSVLTRMHYCK